MYIVNCKTGQSITINNEIEIKTLRKKGGIRLGIDAPKYIQIVHEKLLKEKL